jgi:cytochrome c-type protein NapB
MNGVRRIAAISFCIAMFAVGVFVIGEYLRGLHAPASPAPIEQLAVVRAGTFAQRAPGLADDMQPASGVKIRSLQGYYDLRAYAGAPPVIPHTVDPKIARGQRCGICHEKGGFVNKFNAYAPVSPHPEYRNCLQCHVESNGTELFVEHDWISVRRPIIGRPALPGNPPPIPHTLQLRGNCLACHAGPAAVVEVRTSHPEWINCRQCHVPRQVQAAFARAER